MGKIITSLDIGIRNLAYCTMEYIPSNISGNQFLIHNWNVIDLLKNEVAQKRKMCQIAYKSGPKIGNTCEILAHYYYEDDHELIYLCKRHAKSYESSQLKRLYTTGNISLCELACLAVRELDKIDFSQTQEVILESQPSKNPKMKNLSMMLLNYFIIRYMAEKSDHERKLIDAKFVSSRGKLTIYDGPYVECKLKDQHARNKFYGKIYCQYLIRNNPEKLAFLREFRKKDDLCDSFLQGAWYLLNGYKQCDYPDSPKKITLKLKSVCDIESTNSPNTESEPKKLKLVLKKSLIGKELIKNIKTTPVTVQIRTDYYLNKYKHLKRGRKPGDNVQRYTLSHIKYLLDHHQYDPSNHRLMLSLKYYFGEEIQSVLK